MFRSLLFVLVGLCALHVTGQDQSRDYMPTPNLEDRGSFNKKKFQPERKRYPKIYKNNTEGTLYGNPCALNATRKMGFEYEVQVPGMPGSKSYIGHFLNNFWVKTKVVMTRGPWWKAVLKKRFKQCRSRTGDGIG